MRIPVEKLITDKYWNIIEKHGNPQWAIDELNWLIYEVHKGEYYNLNETEKYRVNKCMKFLAIELPTRLKIIE